jgi:cobyrinic acid a,c-diamide synthase
MTIASETRSTNLAPRPALQTANVPRVILAGASSDVGKTTLALGIVGALRKRGRKVVAAKSGPDFIDSAHLTAVSGRPARNLDAWLTGEGSVASSFARASKEADIAIVEGAMGLFDGRHGCGDGSSAHLARILGAPVILVLDCAKVGSTVGAIAYGLANFDARIRVAGAILNRVEFSTCDHRSRCRPVSKHTGPRRRASGRAVDARDSASGVDRPCRLGVRPGIRRPRANG